MSAARWSLLTAIALLAGCAAPPQPAPWTPLFDGQALTGWQATNFGGEGPIELTDGAVELDIGSPMTGLTWTGAPPAGDYDLEVIAARVDGTDFFCGLTFPVHDGYLTLVLGGWGGSVCGLSSLDGLDAARNETRTLQRFENGRDYTVLVQVRQASVDVLLDGAPLLRADLEGRELTLRPEVELCRPVGIACFSTRARLRTVRWRPAGR